MGSDFDSYCAVSGSTIYSGDSDTEATLPSSVTQLSSFFTAGKKVMLAAALGWIGEIHILDASKLTRQIMIGHSFLKSIDSFIIVDQKE